MTSNTAPAHRHATGVAVYPALLKIGLDFKQQYLRFYWTDLAEILHASRKKAYFSSPKIYRLASVQLQSYFFEKKRVFYGVH